MILQYRTWGSEKLISFQLEPLSIHDVELETDLEDVKKALKDVAAKTKEPSNFNTKANMDRLATQLNELYVEYNALISIGKKREAKGYNLLANVVTNPVTVKSVNPIIDTLPTTIATKITDAPVKGVEYGAQGVLAAKSTIETLLNAQAGSKIVPYTWQYKYDADETLTTEGTGNTSVDIITENQFIEAEKGQKQASLLSVVDSLVKTGITDSSGSTNKGISPVSVLILSALIFVGLKYIT